MSSLHRSDITRTKDSKEQSYSPGTIGGKGGGFVKSTYYRLTSIRLQEGLGGGVQGVASGHQRKMLKNSGFFLFKCKI